MYAYLEESVKCRFCLSGDSDCLVSSLHVANESRVGIDHRLFGKLVGNEGEEEEKYFYRGFRIWSAVATTD